MRRPTAGSPHEPKLIWTPVGRWSAEPAPRACARGSATWRACGDWVHLWTTLHDLVVLFERVGAEEVAAVLLGAASTASTGAQPFGADAERMGTVAAALRQALGGRALTAADTRGRCMSDEQVVACALGEIDRLLAAPAHPGRG